MFHIPKTIGRKIAVNQLLLLQKGITKTNLYSLRHHEHSSYQGRASLYVHWPYCKRRCSYCNFPKFVPKENTSWTFPDIAIEDAMVVELESCLKDSPIKVIKSVFFGGGTPSLARPQLVEGILTAIQKYCLLDSNVEVTLEANPTSLEAEKLKEFQLCGINRLSLGIQSLQDDKLKLLHRDHDSKEALFCIEKAKEIYPHKLSVDLMFGIPGQTLKAWEEDLYRILNICDDHLSLYQLTLERGTEMFKQIKKGILQMPSEDEEIDMYELAVQRLAEAGFHRYEVSNFARCPSAESVHNKAVWQGGQYVGIGPGAHSRVVNGRIPLLSRLPDGAREAKTNAYDPRGWLEEVKLKGNGARKVIPQSRLDMQMEYIATSLRTSEGAKNENWSTFSQTSLQEIFSTALLDPDLLTFVDGRLRATPKGLNVLDAILPGLINTIKKYYDVEKICDNS